MIKKQSLKYTCGANFFESYKSKNNTSVKSRLLARMDNIITDITGNKNTGKQKLKNSFHNNSKLSYKK